MKSRLTWLLLLAALLAIVVSGSALAVRAANPDQSKYESKVEADVLNALAEAGETDFFVWMTEQADLSPAAGLSTKEAKGQFVFDTLRETAERTQKELRQYLDSQAVNYTPFYIANKIYVAAGNSETVLSIAARADVAQITANHAFQLQPPVDRAPAPDTVEAIEPNLTFVRADEVWDMGYDGEGVVLAGNDTGLAWNVPAIINHYRGWNGSSADHNYNWWDATNTYPTVPNDGFGHGTHTAGTMVGDDGAGNQIGMAPGAKTIHCKNMTDGGSGTDLTFTTCFQWDLAPWDLSGANPNPAMAPDAVTNSWGYWGGNNPVFEDEIAALQAAGIAIEVSAGNEGSGCASLRSPGDYLQVITTGSVQHSSGVLPGTITGFSSRGPSDLYPNDYFPDVMAPGENIRSSVPGGTYEAWSGTSMAGPHVTGLIGLMWSASPALRGDIAQTYDAIYDTAVRLSGQNGSNCGGDYVNGPNNDWGFGTIDSVAAVEEAILRGGPNFTLTATPASRTICAPSNAQYAIDLGQILGYNYSVNLSATGNPAGTVVNFTPGAVVPPGNATFTVGNTGGANAGSYDITITGTGTDPEAKTHSTMVSLSLYNATPGGSTVVSPIGIDQPLVPMFEWTAANQGAVYLLVVKNISSGALRYAVTSDTSYTFATPLDPLAIYAWSVRPYNPCGMGSFAQFGFFRTQDIPPILVVDDDDNAPDVRATYTGALDALGLGYDVWDTGNSDNEPDAAYLQQYEVVIWFTGDEFGGAAGPGSAGESALATYLDAGGCFLISSQDYVWDRGVTGFMQSHLGIASATSDVSQTTVTGAAIYAGLGPYTLAYPFTNYSDLLNPAGGAATGFNGNQGSAAVVSGTHKAVFMGFPYEAIPAAGRGPVMATTLGWCNQ
ncbi:MAG: S8 family serine peptidase [Ardenticatenales bacterium]|nr:S8 family serine peptidase [Ardenticatenales bacterium]